jgi:two-component sensor histidine kinase
LCIETNLMERERHQRRNQAFQDALVHVQQMVVQGQLRFGEHLSPFGEHDGIIVVDADGVIQYVSGIATNLYRKVGHSENLVGVAVAGLSADAGLWEAALTSDRCVEREFEEQGFIWIKKAIPIRAAAGGTGWLLGRFLPASSPEDSHWGVLLTVHDATEARRKERELRIKSAMIQEIHHRVKNNLQTIAALLRLQARRSESEEVLQVLQITINRILSIAVVHEFLAQGEGTPINMKDIAQQVVHQLIRSIVDPEQQIQFSLHGDDVYLPAQQATACALVINELIQNALEHGFVDQDGGAVVIRLRDQGDAALVEVVDNGIGLPSGFDIQRDGSLGLRIVQTLVEEDLKGTLQLRNGRGVRAIVTFPKAPLSQALSPISDL